MTDYSLECAQGSFTLTGQSAGVLASRKLAIGQGSYTISGDIRHPFTSGVGMELFAPHNNAGESAPWEITIDPDGVKLDTTVSVYGVFGTQRGDSTIECTIKQLDEDGVSGTSHSGVGLRWTSANDFAVLAMINPSNGHFEVVDKVGGIETEYYDHAVSGGLSYDTWYVIRIELVGSTAACKLYNASGNLLDSYNHTVNAGAPATGYPTVHNYDSASIYSLIEIWDGSGNIVTDANMIFASVYTSVHNSGIFTSSGIIDFYSDGTNGSYNGWMKILTNIYPVNFRMTGSFTYKSGRAVGVAFRQAANGQTGYEFWYDSNGATSYVRLYKNNMVTSLLSTSAAAMIADTVYPWTLEVFGNTYSWTINGNTYTHTDTSYSSAGYIGIISYRSHNYIDFELAGANLSVQRNLSLSQGSIALTGQSSSILYGRLLTPAYGAFTLSGQSIDLTPLFFRLGCVTAADTTLYTVTASDTCLYTVTASDMRCT